MKMKRLCASRRREKPARSSLMAASVVMFLWLNAAVADNVGEVELAPGKSANCFGTPCTVNFRMPDGEGSYEVRQGAADGTKLGEYPAGETVNLGGFYNSTSFHVTGGDFKPAYLWVSGTF